MQRHPFGLDAVHGRRARRGDRKSTRLNSSHVAISYAVFCLKKKKMKYTTSALVRTSCRTDDRNTLCVWAQLEPGSTVTGRTSSGLRRTRDPMPVHVHPPSHP